jgi:hypothetical protein
MLAADITHDGVRLRFERRFADSSRPVSRPQPKSVSQPTTSSPGRFSAEVLERVERRLSHYLGAVSRVVVKRAALKARDESELYLLVADEIENPAEKKAFIRRAISASGKQ